MKRNLLIIVIAVFTFPVLAQDGQSEVERVIQTYFDGYSAGDTTVMKEAFHPDFHLSWIDPWRKGEEAFKQVNRAGLFAFFGPNWSKLEITATLDEVTVGENSSTAKATVTLKNIVIWTDYLSLLKINERWWIVSKISEGKITPKK